MIKKTFKTPLYGAIFTVVFYDKSEEIEKFFEGAEFDPPIKNFDGGVMEYKGKTYVVFSREGKGYPTPGIIAHEAKHLVNRIFISICHPLCRYQDEPECYLLGWIVNRIHKMKDENSNSKTK